MPTRKSILNKVILLVGLLTAFSITCIAQGGIKGKVSNNKGGTISGAIVTARLDGRDVKAVKSDSKGSFLMESLRAGTYHVVIEAEGYAGGVKHGVQVTNGNTRDLGDRLILSVDQGTLVI